MTQYVLSDLIGSGKSLADMVRPRVMDRTRSFSNLCTPTDGVALVRVTVDSPLAASEGIDPLPTPDDPGSPLAADEREAYVTAAERHGIDGAAISPAATHADALALLASAIDPRRRR